MGEIVLVNPLGCSVTSPFSCEKLSESEKIVVCQEEKETANPTPFENNFCLLEAICCHCPGSLLPASCFVNSSFLLLLPGGRTYPPTYVVLFTQSCQRISAFQVKYELGWSEEDDELDSSDTGPSSLCHPLCQCKKCRPLQKVRVLCFVLRQA